jgi:hypothetical protein
MKRSRIQALSIALLAIGTGCLYGLPQAPDFSGAWSGETLARNQKNILTLVFVKNGDSYSGTISDAFGRLDKVPLQDLRVDKGEMTFYFMSSSSGQEIRFETTVRLNGGKLAGTWTAETGDTGSFEMERKKQCQADSSGGAYVQSNPA